MGYSNGCPRQICLDLHSPAVDLLSLLLWQCANDKQFAQARKLIFKFFYIQYFLRRPIISKKTLKVNLCF